MKKLTHLALLCAVVIIGLLIPPVMAVEVAPGSLAPFIVHPGSQEHPAIDGNMVVWEDGRNGNKDIYFSDSVGYIGDRITDNSASQERPSISGDYIVWQDNRSGDWDIYLYQRSTGATTQLTNDTGKQWLPAISGNYAAWYDDSSDETTIVLYDIAAGDVKAVIDCDAKTTIPFAGTEFKPALSEKYVAWVEEADERIRYYDIAAGTIAGRVSSSTAVQSWPSISGDIIVWEDYRSGTWNPEVYMTDLDDPSGGERQITSAPNDQVSPAISASLIAWEDKRNSPAEERSIYMYDLSAEKEMSVFLSVDKDDEHLYPAVSGNTIVWQRGTSPYSNLYIFIYEPAAPAEPVLTTITVAPTTATLEINDTVAFAATALDQDGNAMTGVTVTWSSGNTTVGTIDATGTFTALVAGTADVTATAGNVSGTATVTVAAEAPAATSITVEPATATATATVNDTVTFVATVLDQFGNEMPGGDVTWESDNRTVGTIDDAGVFTAVTAGTTTVTATAGNASGTATVTVEEPVDPIATSITVAPTATTLTVNGTVTFVATVLDQFDDEMPGVPVTWSCSNETVGTVDADGIFTALATGNTTLTATAGDVAGTATVTVNAEEPVEPVLARITVTPPTATLDIDDIQRFIVTAFDQNDNVMLVGEVTWESSDETVGTIDEDGFFTALAGGTTTVTATAGDVAGTATVTVNAKEPALAKIAVSPSAVTLEVGDTREFSVVAFDRFGSIVPDAEVTWTCSDETVGTIDEDGSFTAFDDGTATVTATGDGATGTATVTVNCDDPVLSRITVTPSAITLAAGDPETFTATALDQDGCEMPGVIIDWTCSDEGVGTIDPCSGRFVARNAGTATVTATSGGVTATADVEVTDECSGVVVSPSAITLDPGDSRQFTATVYDLQDNASDPTVTWSCDDTEVGTITTDGLFGAVCGGTATVTASVAGVNETATGTATVTVRSTSPSELARIVVSPSDLTLTAGNTPAFTATAFDQYGFPMPDVEVTWESSDETVGTIDEDGTFDALEEGTVTLTASADGVSGSACVTVEPSLPVPACIEVEPATATLEAGESLEFVATVFDQCDNEMNWVRVAWSCSDPDVGTIDRAGLFAAFAEGSAGVTALAGNVEGTAAVTITAAPTPEPTTEPTPTPTNPGNSGGSTNHGWSDSDGWSPPTFFAGICENLVSGETFTFSDITVSSVGSVAITAANNVPKLLMTVKETALPTLAEPPGGSTYEYVEIALSWVNPHDISGATVTFTIPARWLEEHDMVPEDVRLMRYVDGGWQILETDVIGEENGKYRFQATTPGFSTFAIAATPENVTAPVEETNVTAEVTETPEVTGDVTTEPTTVPATTPAAPLVYAPLLAPLAFLLWPRKKN